MCVFSPIFKTVHMRFTIGICVALLVTFATAATTAFPDADADVFEFAPPKRRRTTSANLPSNEIVTERRNFMINSLSLLTGPVDSLRSGDFIASENSATMKEWVRKVVTELVAPENGLFEVPLNRPQYVNIHHRTSWGLSPLEEVAYRAAGRLMGYSILHNVPLNMQFPTSFYGQFLHHTLSLNDIRDEDPQLAGFLDYLLSLEDEEELQGFTVEIHGFDYELFLPNRTAIIMAKINSLISENQLPALEIMRQGFIDLIPLEGFGLVDLQTRIAGPGVIEPERFMECIDSHEIAPNQFQMFHNVIYSLSPEDRMDLFTILTELKRVPLAPIKPVRMEPCRRVGGLPIVHGCVRSFELPRYADEAEMMWAILKFIEYTREETRQYF